MKKRFIFDENYIKKYSKKNQARALVIGACALIIIIIIIIVMLANRRRVTTAKPPKPTSPTYEVKTELKVESGSSLPELIDYFEKLENTDLDSIKITYPEEFEITYNTSNCSEEDLEKIEEDSSNIEDFSCVVTTLVTPNTYGVTITIDDEEHTVNLIVQDTVYPVVITKEVEIFEGEKYELTDFISACYDASGECNYAYVEEDDEEGTPIDYSKITEVGEHTIKFIATDKYDNQSEEITANLIIKELDTNVYTVNFNSDGGSPVDKILVEEGSLIAKPTNPTKDGYDFLGWYNGDAEFNFNTPIKSDITLTAKWQIKNTTTTPYPPPPSVINVTSVSLNYKTIYLEIGQTKTVLATVNPSNATNKTVTWSSEDASVASVDNGKITGLKAGTIKVTATSNGKSGSVTVVVREKSGGSSCAYGDSNYNSSKYILSVNLTSNNCAVNPNITYNETISTSDYQRLISDLSAMGISIGKNFNYKANYVSVKNNAGTGLVGYQITIYVSVVDNAKLMSAEYIIKSDGTRQIINNNITKNNVTFK